jgi:hypothetical protein
MKGRDLKCPKCGGDAIDVAPDLDLTQRGEFSLACQTWSAFRCAAGHRFCVHVAWAADDSATVRYLPKVFDP